MHVRVHHPGITTKSPASCTGAPRNNLIEPGNRCNRHPPRMRIAAARSPVRRNHSLPTHNQVRRGSANSEQSARNFASALSPTNFQKFSQQILRDAPPVARRRTHIVDRRDLRARVRPAQPAEPRRQAVRRAIIARSRAARNTIGATLPNAIRTSAIRPASIRAAAAKTNLRNRLRPPRSHFAVILLPRRHSSASARIAPNQFRRAQIHLFVASVKSTRNGTQRAPPAETISISAS